MTDSVPSAPAHPGWFVVSQVKTCRVIYFTDDMDYRPPMEGDWYFITHVLGDLPVGMTLKTCWAWRCDGQGVRSAGDPLPEDAPPRLMESNRKALHRLLGDLVDEWRKPWAPSSVLGETLRAAKLEEARAYQRHVASGTALPELPLLQGLSLARGLSLGESAALVVDRHRATLEAVIQSEAVRERVRHAIDAAITQDDLAQVRRQLLAQLDIRQVAALPTPLPCVAPADLQAPVDDTVRAIEVARLQTQLRYAVNTLRSRVDGGYDQSDGLMKAKAKMAQAVLGNDGQAPVGQDLSLLQNLASSRNLSLSDAARLVLGTVTEAESILRRTEREKDRFLARIDAARSLQDFHTVSQELRAFTHHSAHA